ncbi:CGNR zinc finger domain-containing protein [Agrococcus beijingensis]|uniref:CGNR zinc finger domain-containing protein n=1 Tax=Agrococcus beijingensis TaxID=3068634 RepID=UPI002740E4DE|nr:CGNR zinc finger domain-containing protein [Agrococcus sp. REN33]
MRQPTLSPLLGAPAPVELMNTRWMRRGEHLDAIEHADGLRDWSVATGLVADDAALPDVAELREWRALRDALRAIAAEATDDPRTPVAPMRLDEAAEILNASLGVQREVRRFGWRDGRPALEPAAGDCWEAARGRIAVEALEILTDPAHRIRPCLAPNCPLYFVQSSARQRWCSDACGNRVRVARHAAKQL